MEATYLVRMFADFEAGLRDFWRNGLGRRTVPKMEPLMNRIAAYRSVPEPVLSEAHDVREFRNAIVHEGDRHANPIGIEEARRRLCRFLGRLPRDW